MQFLTRDEARAWCTARGIGVSPNLFLKYPDSERQSIDIEPPSKPGELVALTNYLVQDSPKSLFEGALLWFREWGIWGDHNERIGAKCIELIRAGYGERKQFADAPAQIFNKEELHELHAHIAISLLFGWDLFVVPTSGEYFIFISHDGVVCIVPRTTAVFEDIFEALSSWKPSRNRNWYFRGIDD